MVFMAYEFKEGDKAWWRGQVVTVLSHENGGEYLKIDAIKPPMQHHFGGRYGGTSVNIGDARRQVYSVQPSQLKAVKQEGEREPMPPHIQRLIEGE